MDKNIDLTIEELLKHETPYIRLEDFTIEDWQRFDFSLEKYDKSNEEYNLEKDKVLLFILQQIHYNEENFFKIPHFIRNGEKFQRLAGKYNKKLKEILFPVESSFYIEVSKTKRFCPLCETLKRTQGVRIYSTFFDMDLHLCKNHYIELKDKINLFERNKGKL